MKNYTIIGDENIKIIIGRNPYGNDFEVKIRRQYACEKGHWQVAWAAYGEMNTKIAKVHNALVDYAIKLAEKLNIKEQFSKE